MTLTMRQSNGHASNGGHGTTAAWPSSSVGASSLSASAIATNVSCVESRNGNEPAMKHQKRHSLVDQKRRQWAEEQAEQEEWYPFGKPGSGAPLKSSSERSSQRLRLQSGTVPSGSLCSDGVTSNGSVTDFGGPPVYCQISPGSHCIDGRMPQQQSRIQTAPMPSGYAYGTNGYFPASVARPAPIASDLSCQMYPSTGAVAGALTNHLIPGVAQAQYVSMLPGAVNVSGSDSVGSHPDAGHFAMVPPYVQHQRFGYAQGLRTVPMQEHSQGYLVAPYTPAVVLPESSVASGGRASLTGSMASPSNYVPTPTQQAKIEAMRSAFPRPADAPAPSYTEQWADQLHLWQGDEPHGSPSHQRPNTLELSQSTMPNSINGKINQQSAPIAHTSTPVASGSQPPVTMAWVTPIQSRHPAVQHFYGSPDPSALPMVPQQRMAIVSPLHSKAPSLSGNETLDGSMNMQFLSASFSGSVPATGNDSIHRRRSKIAAPKSEHDVEEKQMKMLEHKMALEEQLAEKRRKQLIEEDRERRELERAERERRLIEEREVLESEQERSRWKKLAEKEEKREEIIMGKVQRAQEEAQRVRHAKLRRHTSSGRHSESDGYESMSPPAPSYTASDGHGHTPIQSGHQDRPTGNPHVGSAVSSGSRSQSLPPSSFERAMDSPSDERPIRPLTKDPLQIWEEMGYAAVGADESTSEPKRNAPVRQSMRKSRSTEATKLEAARRAASLERKRATKPVADKPAGNPGLVTQNGLKHQSKPADSDSMKSDISSINDRLKSAGLISNATFIIETKGDKEKKIKNDSEATTTGSKDAVKRIHPSVVVRNEDKASSPLADGKTINQSSKLADNSKLLEKRTSAGKPVLPSSANASDNPWGDTFGGLNPLLQPLVTRRKKPRQPLPPASVDVSEQSKPIHEVCSTAPKILPAGVRVRSDSLSEMTQANENDRNNNKANKPDGGSMAMESVKDPKDSKVTPVRTPALDRFNAKSPLYGSISAKMKRPTACQSRLMEQLSLLRQQLKMKQKEVEDGLSSPSQNSMRE